MSKIGTGETGNVSQTQSTENTTAVGGTLLSRKTANTTSTTRQTNTSTQHVPVVNQEDLTTALNDLQQTDVTPKKSKLQKFASFFKTSTTKNTEKLENKTKIDTLNSNHFTKPDLFDNPEQKTSLKAVLNNPKMQTLFENSTKRGTTERTNIVFVDEVKTLLSKQPPDKDELKALAAKFLQFPPEKALGINENTRTSLTNAIKNNSTNDLVKAFEIATNEVMTAVEVSFNEFKQSSSFFAVNHIAEKGDLVFETLGKDTLTDLANSGSPENAGQMIKDMVTNALNNNGQNDQLVFMATTMDEETTVNNLKDTLQQLNPELSDTEVTSMAENIKNGMLEGLKEKNDFNFEFGDKGYLKEGSTVKFDGETFTLSKKLGEGGFGIGYKFTHIGEDNVPKHIVVKVPVDIDGAASTRAENISESDIHRKITGKPNVLELKGNIRFNNDIFMNVTEFASGGSLKNVGDKLNKLTDNGILSYEDKKLIQKFIIKESIIGLKSMHETGGGITHLDLKADNIFFDASNGKPLMADFGTSREVGSTESRANTPHYVSPENNNNLAASDKMDIWSMGVVLNEMISDQKFGLYDLLQVESGLGTKLDEFASDKESIARKMNVVETTDDGETVTKQVEDKTSLGNLVNKMLAPKAEDRIGLDEILDDDMLDEIDNERALKLISIIYSDEFNEGVGGLLSTKSEYTSKQEESSQTREKILSNIKEIGNLEIVIDDMGGPENIETSITNIKDEIAELKIEEKDLSNEREQLSIQEKAEKGSVPKEEFKRISVGIVSIVDRVSALNKELKLMESALSIDTLKEETEGLKENLNDLQNELVILKEPLRPLFDKAKDTLNDMLSKTDTINTTETNVYDSEGNVTGTKEFSHQLSQDSEPVVQERNKGFGSVMEDIRKLRKDD